jgi:DNA-binding NarL/FixJ family response regulator
MLCSECDKRNACDTLCEEAKEYAEQDAPNYHKPGEGTHLTPTEKKILSLLARGRTREQIRNHLKLSVNTLEVHIHNLKKKAEEIVL